MRDQFNYYTVHRAQVVHNTQHNNYYVACDSYNVLIINKTYYFSE